MPLKLYILNYIKSRKRRRPLNNVNTRLQMWAYRIKMFKSITRQR